MIKMITTTTTTQQTRPGSMFTGTASTSFPRTERSRSIRTPHISSRITEWISITGPRTASPTVPNRKHKKGSKNTRTSRRRNSNMRGGDRKVDEIRKRAKTGTGRTRILIILIMGRRREERTDNNNHNHNHNHNNRDPVAIQTYPLQGGAARRQRKAKRASETAKSIGTPFPTLFWLCHPAICRAIGELEQLGYVTSLQQRLNQCPDSVELFLNAHQQYATLRWSTLEVQHRTILEQNDGMRKVLQESGIAGTNFCLDQTPHIKCLHAHYAHYRSGGNNPVGLWIHQLLQKEYPDVIL